MSFPYTITNSTVTVIVEGETYVVKRGAVNFDKLQAAILDNDWKAVPSFLTVAKTITEWSSGDFKLVDGKILHKTKEVPKGLHERLLAMVTEGSDPKSLMRFWERLQENPSRRSVQMLFEFLQHSGIPITEDGHFLAYKGVKSDYKDSYTGTIDNSPGASPPRIPRNEVSDDPRTSCHFGYHVGALSYAQRFSSRTIICKVDPADVVCVPYDSSQQKMRLTYYTVVGNYGGRLNDGAITKEEVGVETKPDEAKPTEPVEAKPVRFVKDAKPKGAKPTKTKPSADDFNDLAELDQVDLLNQTLDRLRKYATYGLKIVGASKIPGGKYALTTRIVEVRDGK